MKNAVCRKGMLPAYLLSILFIVAAGLTHGNRNALFAAEAIYAGSANPGVVYEYAGGKEWNSISPPLGRAVLSLVDHDGVLYAGVQSYQYAGQVYRNDGGNIWTLIGEMDSQVASLAVWNGKLYAGTVGGSRGLYRYNAEDNTWSGVLSGLGSGIRAMHVWERDNALYIGDYNSDTIWRYDGSALRNVMSRGRSCIWDFEPYRDMLYASAYYGMLYGTFDGIFWNSTYVGGSDIWALEEFLQKLYYGDGMTLKSFDGTNSQAVAAVPRNSSQDEILSLESNGTDLYIGVGGEAGYYNRSIGTGMVYRYNGVRLEAISAQMGTAVQVIHISADPPIGVVIDIKPGSDENPLNMDSKGSIPVAVLTTSDFEAAAVDPSSVFFGFALAIRHSLEDLDNDGTLDLVLHFRTDETGIQTGDTEAVLRGRTYDGRAIKGTDHIRVLGSRGNKPGKPAPVSSFRHNVGVPDCDVAAVSGNIIAISMEEDQTDYNGDGDTNDRVLGYYDIRKKELVNTGIVIGNSVSIDGDTIVFEVYENDAWTLAYYTLSKSKLANTGIAVYRFGNDHHGPTRIIDNGRIVYLSAESEINVFDIRTGNVFSTGVQGSSPSISGDIITYVSGAYWWSGEIGYYNLRTGSVYDTGIQGSIPVASGNFIVFNTGAGVSYYDIAKAQGFDTPLAGCSSASISSGVLSALCDEDAYWGDLNGDGDTDDDYMVVAYDIAADRVINTGVQGCCGTDISSGVIVFDTYEGDIHTDLNGDGDTSDCVQQYVILKEVLLNKLPSGPSGRPAEQWAVTAVASSEWDPMEWAAWQATGEPNTFQCGDIVTAWAPLGNGPEPEWITLGFAAPVHATGLRVHETFESGFLYQIDLIDTSGSYHTIWTGSDTTACPGWFELSFPKTSYRVQGARLYTQINGWEEVDAVALLSQR